MRCVHEFLPDQCGVCVPERPCPVPIARAHVLREFAFLEDQPQVTARVIVQPTTDVAVRRLGHDIPKIGYGHWGVLVDDSATRDLRAEREALADEQRRSDLIDALMGHNSIGATITLTR